MAILPKSSSHFRRRQSFSTSRAWRCHISRFLQPDPRQTDCAAVTVAYAIHSAASTSQESQQVPFSASFGSQQIGGLWKYVSVSKLTGGRLSHYKNIPSKLLRRY